LLLALPNGTTRDSSAVAGIASVLFVKARHGSLQTRLYSFLLGTSLLAEAFIQWPFWSTSLGPRYEMHARDHFCVNIGVSGGMLLLASLGAGQYSMDEWLKKND
jgi:uncharacterized membrane protein YphA (DoxX/SURF4 family)